MNYFSEKELACQHCGEYKFDPDALIAYNAMRHECGFPWRITSGYRCPEHPIEAKKSSPGAHSRATAIDIAYKDDGQLLTILKIALSHGVKRIGINEKGTKFIHLDFDKEGASPAYWQY